MSDDGFYIDDEYDDFDEMMWNDDGEIILADDLAEHTMPSPVHLYDPRDENANSYSDWEYYSDDYYDDDPRLIKAAEGDVPREKPETPAMTRKSKKRKIETKSDNSEHTSGGGTRAEMMSLKRWMKGTTWKQPSPDAEEDPECYEPGKVNRVALLNDWRDRFEADQHFETKPSRAASESYMSEEELLDLAEELMHEVGLELPGRNNHTGVNPALEEDSAGEEVDVSRRRKRRRIASPDQPPLQGTDTGTEAASTTASKSGQESQPVQVDLTSASIPTPIKNRKRKAGNVEADDTQDSLPRAKRIASSNVNVKGKAKMKDKPPPVPTTRATRSQKQ